MSQTRRGRPLSEIKTEKAESPIRPTKIKKSHRDGLKPTLVTTSGVDLIDLMALSIGPNAPEIWQKKFAHLKRLVLEENNKTFMQLFPQGSWNDGFVVKSGSNNLEQKLKKEFEEKYELLDRLRRTIKAVEIIFEQKPSKANSLSIAHGFLKIGILSILTGIHTFPDADRGKSSRHGGGKRTTPVKIEKETKKQAVITEFNRMMESKKLSENAAILKLSKESEERLGFYRSDTQIRRDLGLRKN